MSESREGWYHDGFDSDRPTIVYFTDREAAMQNAFGKYEGPFDSFARAKQSCVDGLRGMIQHYRDRLAVARSLKKPKA